MHDLVPARQGVILSKLTGNAGLTLKPLRVKVKMWKVIFKFQCKSRAKSKKQNQWVRNSKESFISQKQEQVDKAWMYTDNRKGLPVCDAGVVLGWVGQPHRKVIL